VQVVMRFQREATALFTYAIFGTGTACQSVQFGGGGGADSFDSSAGTYTATKLMSGGNLGSNGNIDLSGGGGTAPLIKVIAGTLSTPTPDLGTNSCPGDPLTVGTGWTMGTYSQLPGTVSYPNPDPISPSPGTLVQNIRNDCATIPGCSCLMPPATSPTSCTNNGPYVLQPGTYQNATLGGGKEIHFIAGTYNFNTFSLSGTLVVDSGSGPVVINAAATAITTAGTCCALDFSGAVINNNTGTPSKLRFNYAGKPATTSTPARYLARHLLRLQAAEPVIANAFYALHRLAQNPLFN
jgi:hypothetical protein